LYQDPLEPTDVYQTVNPE